MQFLQGSLKATSLGLDNLKLVEGGVESLDFDQHEFDYIIAHGVYSWVSPRVQSEMFRLIQACLSDNGVAYISYNTLPGWHIRSVARDLMMSAVDEAASIKEQVAAARNALEHFASSLSDTSLHGEVIRSSA